MDFYFLYPRTRPKGNYLAIPNSSTEGHLTVIPGWVAFKYLKMVSFQRSNEYISR
jgi:hypothetical protein